MKLNNKLFIGTSIAALLVVFGVVTKNSSGQLGGSKIGNIMGMMMFVLGWVLTAYMLSVNKDSKALFVLGAAGIVMAAMAMKSYKKDVPMFLPIIFSVCWLLLGFLTSNHLKGMYKYSGLIASLLVLVSMMVALPMQRKKNIVDGPGMPLFVIAWFILVVANSSLRNYN